MFSNISWGDYFMGAVIVLACYYFLVAAGCYRRDITGLLTGKKNNSLKPSKVIAEDSVEELERVMDDLNGILEKAAPPIIPPKGGTQGGKSELLTQLKERLASFAGLRQPAYRVALTNYIIKYSKTFCGVTFSEDELEEAWETLLR